MDESGIEGALNISLTIGTLEAGGAQRNLTFLANYWAERGNQVSIITLNGLTDPFYPLHPSIKITSAVPPSRRQIVQNLRRMPFDVRELLMYFCPYLVRHAWRLREALMSQSPKIVLSFIDSCNGITLLALLNSSIPRVVAERSDPGTAPLARIWRVLRRILYPTADRVIVQTTGAADFFHGRARRKMLIVPSPAVVPDTSQVSDIDVPRPAIVALGRFVEEKRFGDLIDAFGMIAKRHSAWSLVIVGDGPLRPELMRKVSALGLDGRVFLPGITRNAGAVLLKADIFTLSSRFEGFPTVLCEAMALGRPVVSTDCPSGPRAIVRNGVDGILVPPLVPQALAHALERLISYPELRDQLGTAALQIKERFSPEKVFATWDDILQTAIRARSRNS